MITDQDVLDSGANISQVHDPAPAAGNDVASRGQPAGWIIAAIRGYQLLRSGRPTGCRFLPTCSDYAVQAIEVHGATRGASLTLRRLLRCTPWGGHGVDPVPDRRTPCSDH
ncbi:MAG: membrane protein insertion efficiency factor YidD [Acidimicrobiales bacterium]